jgi:hypothetical protein
MLRTTIAAILFAACVILPAGRAAFAQEASSSPTPTAAAPDDPATNAVRMDIRSHRKQVTAANLTLTTDEATKFWPIYDQYIQDTIKINDTRWALMKDYAANYEKMTDELAAEYMKKSAAVDQQLVALREKYVPLFEKVISVQKTAKWYQIDRRLDLMINMQLSAMVPIVDLSNPNSQ